MCDVPDVPKQYKKLTDENTLKLFEAGRWLYAIVEELGNESYEATDGKIKITITKETNQ